MTPKRRHKVIRKFKEKYSHIATFLAGTALVAGALLGGLPLVKLDAAAKKVEKDTPLVAEHIKNEMSVEPPIKLKPVSNNINTNNFLVNQTHENPYESKILQVKATAYAPGAHDNGKWGNKTHLGTIVKPGVIAVDPKVIPLGSKVEVELPDGRKILTTAEDTGGAIKGNRIDIAMATVAEAKDFGIQNVKVRVLGKPKPEQV